MKKTMRTVVLTAFAVMMFVLAGGVQAQPQDQGGQGGGRRGNFDPAQMMDRMMERYKETLKATDEEWTVIKPLLTDVLTKSMGGRGGRGMMFGGSTRGRQGGDQAGQGGQRPPRGGMFGGTPDPTADALSTALDNESTPASEIQAKLAAYRDAQKKREEAIKEAREKLRKVLTLRQEARLVLSGQLD